MKYYIYISDTKVDMLYPQIPKPVLKRIASSLSIDLKLLGAELSVGIKNNQVDETRYAKVRIVSEYIEKHLDVGSIDAPSTYFKGKLFISRGHY
ncbi:MAG TPA: SAVMC3_10250 family protein [Methylomirabilota bacterium]|nr:SAVMC3_10250 family protein [Methylomirabilota bacterium]